MHYFNINLRGDNNDSIRIFRHLTVDDSEDNLKHILDNVIKSDFYA